MNTYVIGIDPGDTTGLAIWTRALSPDIETRQLKHQHVHNFLKGVVAVDPEGEWVFAVERFVIAKNTVRKRHAAKVAPELIGAIRSLASEIGGEVRMRGASEAKTFSPNAKLIRAGWYRGGQGHANDALRQVLLCIAECWPNDFAKLMGV